MVDSKENYKFDLGVEGLRQALWGYSVNAQEHNALSQPGLKPRLLDPESNALTIRPLSNTVWRESLLYGKQME